ncbi:hypothetical protein Clim_0589 [Chlorobium limicola DSM 245]|uniref:Uncharacterized protein n=2 Tax=Chlorobium limicola TaxID=1092 RepID=B3EGZ7_CHLL2|nr:hypothetical protein Clim_0589 [Chlorobium limicola DSM 245]
MLTFAMRSIIFYKTPSGQCPVKEFLTNLTDKERQKVTWVLTPAQEIALAEQRKKDYEKRQEH